MALRRICLALTVLALPQAAADLARRTQVAGAPIGVPGQVATPAPAYAAPSPYPPAPFGGTPAPAPQSVGATADAIYGSGAQTTKRPGLPFDAKKIIGPVVGAVAGAGALAAVIAVSVAKPKNATNATALAGQAASRMVNGTLTLRVLDGPAFVRDETAQKAVGAGIADAAQVTPNYMTVRAHLPNVSARRLIAKKPDTVLFDYKITIPITDKQHTPQAVDSTLSLTSPSVITKDVQARLKSTKGANVQLIVIKQQVGKHPVQIAKTCDVFQCPASYIQRANSGMIEGSAWQTCCKAKPTTTPSPTTTRGPTTTTPGPTTTTTVTTTSSTTSTTDDFLMLPLARLGNGTATTPLQNLAPISAPQFAGLTTTRPTNSSRGSSSSAGGSHEIMLLGIGGGTLGCVLLCCAIIFCRKCCPKKKRGRKHPTQDSVWPDDDSEELAAPYDMEPLILNKGNKGMIGTQFDLPGTSPDIASQYMPAHPDMASQYTGSAYAPQNARQQQGMPFPAAAPAAVYAGMTSLPPPPPPPAGAAAWQNASPLANTVQSMPTANALLGRR